MSWFERITGIAETSYEDTQRALSMQDGRLFVHGRDTGRSVGTFEMPSLAELRRRASLVPKSGRLRSSIVIGDVRAMHSDPQNAGALFQVASQFNMLEMISPRMSPEDGVARYETDRTQGPACAIAAGAATIYRNYLVPIGDRSDRRRFVSWTAWRILVGRSLFAWACTSPICGRWRTGIWCRPPKA